MESKITILLRDITDSKTRILIEIEGVGFDHDKTIKKFIKKFKSVHNTEGRKFDIYIGIWDNQASYTLPTQLIEWASVLGCSIYVDFND